MSGSDRFLRGFLLAAVALAGSGMVAAPMMGQETRAPKNELVSLLFKTKAGVTLNYVEQGDPKGPVVVLLHGAGDSWHSYDRVYPLLPRRLHVYGITLRGHGLSDHPAMGFSSEDFAGDISDFIARKGLQQVTLVGHSLGSFVAQKVAETDSEGHLAKLVLIGSGPGTVKAAAGTEQASLFSSFAALEDPIPYTFARDFQASTIYYPVPAENFEMWVAECQRVPATTWHGLAKGHLGSAEELKKIKVPTLLLWGEKDSIFSRADQDALLKLVAKARLSAYAETGHALHWERPERFATELVRFVEASSF